MTKALVIGNTTLDVLCYHVDDVPRYDSLLFDRVALAPGGCGSNVAIGLCALGVPTALVTSISDDEAYAIVERYWQRTGLDDRFVMRIKGGSPAVSVGLVDSAFQPRFVHTPGSNSALTSKDLNIDAYIAWGAQVLMVAGFYVLPGLLDGNLPAKLAEAQSKRLTTILDVANAKRMDEHPELLWDCLSHLDIYICNTPEAKRLTGLDDPMDAARDLRKRGVQTAVVKLGADGCYVDSADFRGHIPGVRVENVVDTTGAGDAFAAGLIAALLESKSVLDACIAANASGARVVSVHGAITAWMENF